MVLRLSRSSLAPRAGDTKNLLLVVGLACGMKELHEGLSEALAAKDVVSQDSSESLEWIRGNPSDPKRALLLALEEAIMEQRGGSRASVTEVFAAGMAGLEASSKRGELGRLPELLGLLVACAEHAQGSVLRAGGRSLRKVETSSSLAEPSRGGVDASALPAS